MSGLLGYVSRQPQTKCVVVMFGATGWEVGGSSVMCGPLTSMEWRLDRELGMWGRQRAQGILDWAQTAACGSECPSGMRLGLVFVKRQSSLRILTGYL